MDVVDASPLTLLCPRHNTNMSSVLDKITHIMSRLVLDEQRIGAVFDEVGDVAVAQAVHRELGGKRRGAAPVAEALVDPSRRDAGAALGEPHGGPARSGAVEGADLVYVLLDDTNGPHRA